MSTPLFLDNLPELDSSFKKEAGFATRLSETPDNWPQELTSELLKQLPYLSDYDMNVNLAKVDPQRRYAFGYADISNRTERPEVEHTEAGLPHVRIPLVVKEGAAKPFTVFLDGEDVIPLNEERIREILFNPQTFDLSTSTPRDPSLVEPLMPPQRSGIGMGGQYKVASALMTEASVGSNSPLSFPLEKYRGTPLLKKAIEIERRQLELDSRDSATMPAVNEKLLKDRRKLEFDRRALDLELAALVDSKTKTAEMRSVERYYGDGGLQQIVDGWMEEFRRLNAKPLDKTAMDKTAFNHISKPQWDAIYKSDAIQKLVQKHGGPSHPEVTNKVYEIASKTYGFHPKVYSMSPEMKAQKAQEASKPGKPDTANKTNAAGGKPKTASLLSAIAPTISQRDRDAFVEKVASDATLRAGFRRSGITSTLVEVMDGEKYASTSEMMADLADRIAPTAVTLQKLPGGDFLVKRASNDAFVPPQASGEVVPGAEAAEAIGQEQAMAMQPGQTATAVADPVEEKPLFESNERVCDEFGEWLVVDAMGNRIMGWVFPTTLAWDGNFTPEPIALFTNGSAYAFQDTIAGELVGKSTTFPADPPRGDGVFYATEGGKAVCTAPITIGSAAAGPDGSPMFMGQDMMGNPVQIHLAEGLTMPTRVTDTEYALPSTWKFMRLNNQTQLSQDPVQMNKAASVIAAQSEVTLSYNGSFHLKGGCGLNKLASSFTYDLDPVSAEFMLGVLGVDGTRVKSKLAEARRKGSVKLAGLKTITLFGERFKEETKIASAFIQKLPNLRRDLIKEAAALEDEATVDNLLALNFINPENLGIFVSYRPQLEDSSEKLAEMLLSSYLGMDQLPEGAIERGMKNLEEVISGLKSIQHAES